MSDPIIEISNVSKKYRIGHTVEPYYSLRDSLTNAFKFGGKPKTDVFWALQDVSANIYKGESVGIIGRNGAGKSTLLKVLSRITPPTSGKIIMRGRVASLLEVGTGFHQELTGRENIFLNGSILGMSRREIASKFDEIVAFAEIEQFLDTPVKRYSSGMYVRLAFAVAAHLQPEILIVDEVLAVGDTQFQKKCLGKMESISSGAGRTILFVSHNMAAVRQLCQKTILLQKGRVVDFGKTSEMIAKYEQTADATAVGSWENTDLRSKDEVAFIKSVSILNDKNEISSSFLNSESANISFDLMVKEKTPGLKVGFDLIKDGMIVFRSEQTDYIPEYELKAGLNHLACEIPAKMLNVGSYEILPQLSIHCVKGLFDLSSPVLAFDISIDPKISEFHTVLNESNHPGAMFPILKWSKSND